MWTSWRLTLGRHLRAALATRRCLAPILCRRPGRAAWVRRRPSRAWARPQQSVAHRQSGAPAAHPTLIGAMLPVRLVCPISVVRPCLERQKLRTQPPARLQNRAVPGERITRPSRREQPSPDLLSAAATPGPAQRWPARQGGVAVDASASFCSSGYSPPPRTKKARYMIAITTTVIEPSATPMTATPGRLVLEASAITLVAAAARARGNAARKAGVRMP